MLPRMRRRSTLAVFIHSLRQPYESKRPEKEVVLLCSFFLLAEDRSKRADLAPQRSFAAMSSACDWLRCCHLSPASSPCRLAEMSQSRSPGGLLAGISPCVVLALQSVGPAAPAASCTSQHFVTAVWRISVAGRDFARGAQATSSQLYRHKAGLTLSTLDSLKFLWVPACTSSSYVSIIAQSTATASAVSRIA